MQIIKRVGKWWVEMERPEIDPTAESLMLWIGIMLTVLNIFAAILVFG